MRDIVMEHGRLSSGPNCAAAAYVAAALAPAAAAAREMSSSCNPPNSSSPVSFTCSFATTCSISSSCASSSCSSCSCTTCPSYTTMSWTERDAEVTSRHDNGNEIKDGEGHDDREIGGAKTMETQAQQPIAGITERTPIPQPSSGISSFPPSQHLQAAGPTSLSTVGKEARLMLSTTESPPSAALPPPPLASIVSIAHSPSESNPQRHADASSVPVSQPTGFRLMPRDPNTGRRICFYFNHTGCMAGARCAYTHIKTDISNIIPGAFHKSSVPSAPFSTGLPSLTPSRPVPSSFSYSSWEVTNYPRQHHSPSLPFGTTLPPFPAFLPSYVPPGPPLFLPATPAYVMYVGVPPSYSRSLPPSHTSSLPHFLHEGAPRPVPTLRGGGRGERVEGGWGDAQWYHHQMQPGQQAVGIMEEEWMGGLMGIRGVDMHHHQQHAYYEQHYHYYPYQQMLQQDEQEAQEEQGEQEQ